MPAAWADALSVLRAPLGTYAVLGNHDWWHGPVPGMAGGPEEVTRALNGIGVRVLANDAVLIDRGGKRFWLAGLADQLAYGTVQARSTRRGADDLAATLKHVRDDAPVLMLAHEPYVVPPHAGPGGPHPLGPYPRRSDRPAGHRARS